VQIPIQYQYQNFQLLKPTRKPESDLKVNPSLAATISPQARQKDGNEKGKA